MDELNQPQAQNSNIPPTPPPLRPVDFPTPPAGYAGQGAGQAPNIPSVPQTNIVPPSPTTPDAYVRTMGSDIQSMRASGGTEPVPVSFSNNPAPAPMPEAQEVKSGKTIFWLIILIIIVGIGWITYQYGLPAYRAITETQPAPEAIPQPTAPQPETADLGATPPPPAPAPATTPLGGALATLVKIETDGTAASITAGLAAETKKGGITSDTMQEVSIMNNGARMSFDTVMNALLPEATTNGLAGIFTAGFDPNFSAYIFYDDRGAWPGYVAKINPASQIDTVTLMSRLQAFETSSYQNLFLTNPGESYGFKTGQARGKYIDRFVPLATPGALFNYGIFGDYLIINTSNNGLVKALDLLKL